MVWAHILSKAGSMSNTFEFEEVMQAAFAYGTEQTVAEVIAEHERRHEEASKPKPKSPFAGRQTGPVNTAKIGGTPAKSEMDKLREMQAAGQKARELNPGPPTE